MALVEQFIQRGALMSETNYVKLRPIVDEHLLKRSDFSFMEQMSGDQQSQGATSFRGTRPDKSHWLMVPWRHECSSEDRWVQQSRT